MPVCMFLTMSGEKNVDAYLLFFVCLMPLTLFLTPFVEFHLHLLIVSNNLHFRILTCLFLLLFFECLCFCLYFVCLFVFVLFCW